MKMFSVALLALALLAGPWSSVETSSAQPEVPGKGSVAKTAANPKTGLKALASPKSKIAPRFTGRIDVSVSSSSFTVTGSGLQASAQVTIRVTRLDTLQ